MGTRDVICSLAMGYLVRAFAERDQTLRAELLREAWRLLEKIAQD